jgi:uncharacterized sulfatase
MSAAILSAVRNFVLGSILFVSIEVTSALAELPRPNILWITSEDHGPHMGCYGDQYATTPNVDRLASTSLMYRHCWSNAPVCAPARTTLISGMYPPSTGSEHMRSMVEYPSGKKMSPQFLREAGYYCTNNAKEDYNLTQPGKVWDVSSRNAHWRDRPENTPFFAVFNSEKSHESKIRIRPHTQVHDPAKVRIPAYHPDQPEVREDWAQYYDAVSDADADAGRRLKELEEAGLVEDTVVFYYADHGSGMPRNKRWPYNSGLHVPLVVHIPEKFAHLRPPEYKAGGTSDRLVSFVDFAPTLLSLAGIRPPDWMQGHAFLGSHQTAPQPFVYGFRGRMDERYDLVRSVTDGRWVYVRNYMPHLIYGQHIDYMFQTPTTRVWKQLHDAGKLTPEQDAFWKPKASEELYDLHSDPDEVHNLASDTKHSEILGKLRSAQRSLALQIRDVGFIPEGERFALCAGTTPYDLGHDDDRYPIAKILETAELASNGKPESTRQLIEHLSNTNSSVRYWAALGILSRGKEATQAAGQKLINLLDDPSAIVAITAAESLARYVNQSEQNQALRFLVSKVTGNTDSFFPSLLSLGVLEALGPLAESVRPALLNLTATIESPNPRLSGYVPRLLQSFREQSTVGGDPAKAKPEKKQKTQKAN